MKNFLLFFFLSMTIASSANADGADDWQDVDFNTDILNQLNQCGFTSHQWNLLLPILYSNFKSRHTRRILAQCCFILST